MPTYRLFEGAIMLFSVRFPLAIASAFFLFSVLGCGEKTVVASGSTKNEQSQACIDCHQNVVNPVTGKVIVEEWKLSNHNTSNGAGCADCHEPEQGHPTGCNLCHGGTPAGSSTHVSNNPDRDGKCYKCHGSTNGIFPTGARRHHFAKTAADYPSGFSRYSASYVSLNYIGNCRKCHNPHNSTSNIGYNRAWANSGHGRITEPSRGSDFKTQTRGTPVPANLVTTQSYCVRCHTTTGHINFLSTNFLSVQSFGSADITRELTGCDACHTDYSFKLRAVPPVTIFYNISGVPTASSPGGHVKIQNNSVLFPNLGSSNMCVPCHSGRGIGSQIKLLRDYNANFTKSSSPSAHNLNEAALLTAKSGYEFTDEVTGNLKNYVTGVGANTGHDTFGLSSGKGPCITCHMNKVAKSDSHTFKPVVHGSVFSLYTTNRIWSQVYSINSTNMPLGTLTIASVTSQSCYTIGCHDSLSPTELTNYKEGFISALAVLNKWLRLVRNVTADTVYNLPAPK
jgi:hypothetical protein